MNPPFFNGGDEGFPKWARLGGGCKILRNNGGDAKKGGDDLRIGGMALLTDNFL